METNGTLKGSEPHPSAYCARDYLLSLGIQKLYVYLESYSSCAIEGNRLGEICSETLSRFLKGAAISDRYLLGLAWSIKQMEEARDKK